METTTEHTTLWEMIDAAERQGLWLFSSYQHLWFSPAELRAENAEGRFRWGPVSWQLRDPQERVQELLTKRYRIDTELEHFRQRMREAD